MKSTSCIAVLAVSGLWLSPASAADPEHKLTGQQSRMATCAHESKGMGVDERHRFMSECLKGHDASAQALLKDAPIREANARPEAGSQQNRMKACNEEAGMKDLHGDERKAFMSNCLKG